MPPPTKESVLELEVRRRIVDAVREHPGLHLRALAEQLDLPVSTLEYHCYQLVRHGQMTSRQDGGYKAFYPAEGLDRRDKDILYLVRHEPPRRICTHLLESPGATPKEIRSAIGMAAPTLSFHIKKLVNAGLVNEEPAGRTKHLFLDDPERVASVLVTYRASFLDEAVDRFAETWLGLGRPAKGGKNVHGAKRPAGQAASTKGPGGATAEGEVGPAGDQGKADRPTDAAAARAGASARGKGPAAAEAHPAPKDRTPNGAGDASKDDAEGSNVGAPASQDAAHASPHEAAKQGTDARDRAKARLRDETAEAERN